MVLLGMTGTDGAGKGTVVKYLTARYGFVHCSARALLTDALTKEGREIDRAGMRQKANELRRAQGDAYLMRTFHECAVMEGWTHVVVDSLRALAEVEALHDYGGTLIAVDAEVHVRYERIRVRGSESDFISFEEFIRHEELEMNDPDPHGMQKAAVMRAADHTLMNNGTVEDLVHAVDALMGTLGIPTAS